MPNSFFHYEYTDLRDGKKQYEDVDFSQMIGVPAEYAKVDSDKGNPFIEALPKPRSQEELAVAGSRGIPGFVREKELEKSMLDKVLDILKLRDVRYPLPMNFELENEVYSALVLSYRARHMFRDDRGDIRVEYEAKNITHSADGILIGSDAAATNAGVSLIGYSGCGKSSALETLFSNYPQYIIHRGDGLTTYPQIVYLVVQCPPHSNFRGLYKNIGVAIDRALGNLKPIYEKLLDAGERGNLSRFRDKVRELIEKFCIGIIIFDEIQHLNFDTTAENSFESILELANQTKVAFGVVGTEDAYSKVIGFNLRQTRRLGPEIHADKYCKNTTMFSLIVSKIFQYQWFDTVVVPTPNMINAMFRCTHGIIDQIIGLYIFMNLDYIRAKKKPTVDEHYVEKTYLKHYPGMAELIQELFDNEVEERRMEIVNHANREMMEIVSEETSKAAEQATMSALQNDNLNMMIEAKQYAVGRIMEVNDTVSATVIEKTCDRFLKTQEGQKLLAHKEFTKIAQQVNKRLSASESKKENASKKKSAKLDSKTIKSYLLNDDAE